MERESRRAGLGFLRDGTSRGFALVVSLMMMLLLTVLVFGLLSLSSVSLRTSGKGEEAAIARANAEMALSLAIGELQKQTGTDPPITTTADQLSAGRKGDESRRHWNGVFGSWDATAAVRPTPEFRRWPVSGKMDDVTSPEFAKSSSAVDPAELMGTGTLGTAGGQNVVAPLAFCEKAGGLQGRHAWWVGDRGGKAALPSPDFTPPADLASTRQARQSSPRNAVEWASTGGGVKGINEAELWLYYNSWKELRTGTRSAYTTGGSVGNKTHYLQVAENLATLNIDPENLFKQPTYINFQSVLSFHARIMKNAAGQDLRRLALVVDPIVKLWNPLDQPVVVTPSYNSGRFWQLPYDLKITRPSGTPNISLKSIVGSHHYLTLSVGRAKPGALRPSPAGHSLQNADQRIHLTHGQLRAAPDSQRELQRPGPRRHRGIHVLHRDRVNLRHAEPFVTLLNDTLESGTAANDAADPTDTDWSGSTLTVSADTTLGTRQALTADGGTYNSIDTALRFGVAATDPELAGNDADFDGDGLIHLIVYALGTDPKAFTPLPAPVIEGELLTLIFTRNLLATDVTLIPER